MQFLVNNFLLKNEKGTFKTNDRDTERIDLLIIEIINVFLYDFNKKIISIHSF